MMEFGKSLRAAREAKGYTTAQLAEATHLAPSVIDNLENEDFSRIAAPIYGRGFVKLYCQAVGLDPKPFISEFMDILDGKRELAIKERPVEAKAEGDEKTEVERVEKGEGVEKVERVGKVERVERVEKVEKVERIGGEGEAKETAPEPDLFNAPPPAPASAPAAFDPPRSRGDDSPTLSRYATPFRADRSVLPENTWRIAILAVGALVVLILVICALRALHRATAPAAAEDERLEQPAVAVQEAARPAAAEEKPSQPRMQQKIPDLYLN